MPNISKIDQARMKQEERQAKMFELSMESPAATCSMCGGTVLAKGFTIRRVPKERANLLNLGVFSKDIITEHMVLYCVKCGTPYGG